MLRLCRRFNVHRLFDAITPPLPGPVDLQQLHFIDICMAFARPYSARVPVEFPDGRVRYLYLNPYLSSLYVRFQGGKSRDIWFAEGGSFYDRPSFVDSITQICSKCPSLAGSPLTSIDLQASFIGVQWMLARSSIDGHLLDYLSSSHGLCRCREAYRTLRYPSGRTGNHLRCVSHQVVLEGSAQFTDEPKALQTSKTFVFDTTESELMGQRTLGAQLDPLDYLASLKARGISIDVCGLCGFPKCPEPQSDMTFVEYDSSYLTTFLAFYGLAPIANEHGTGAGSSDRPTRLGLFSLPDVLEAAGPASLIARKFTVANALYDLPGPLHISRDDIPELDLALSDTLLDTNRYQRQTMSLSREERARLKRRMSSSDGLLAQGFRPSTSSQTRASHSRHSSNLIPIQGTTEGTREKESPGLVSTKSGVLHESIGFPSMVQTAGDSCNHVTSSLQLAHYKLSKQTQAKGETVSAQPLSPPSMLDSTTSMTDTWTSQIQARPEITGDLATTSSPTAATAGEFAKLGGDSCSMSGLEGDSISSPCQDERSNAEIELLTALRAHHVIRTRRKMLRSRPSGMPPLYSSGFQDTLFKASHLLHLEFRWQVQLEDVLEHTFSLQPKERRYAVLNQAGPGLPFHYKKFEGTLGYLMRLAIRDICVRAKAHAVYTCSDGEKRAKRSRDTEKTEASSQRNAEPVGANLWQSTARTLGRLFRRLQPKDVGAEPELEVETELNKEAQAHSRHPAYHFLSIAQQMAVLLYQDEDLVGKLCGNVLEGLSKWEKKVVTAEMKLPSPVSLEFYPGDGDEAVSGSVVDEWLRGNRTISLVDGQHDIISPMKNAENKIPIDPGYNINARMPPLASYVSFNGVFWTAVLLRDDLRDGLISPSSEPFGRPFVVGPRTTCSAFESPDTFEPASRPLSPLMLSQDTSTSAAPSTAPSTRHLLAGVRNLARQVDSLREQSLSCPSSYAPSSSWTTPGEACVGMGPLYFVKQEEALSHLLRRESKNNLRDAYCSLGGLLKEHRVLLNAYLSRYRYVNPRQGRLPLFGVLALGGGLFISADEQRSMEVMLQNMLSHRGLICPDLRTYCSSGL
ncbi:hypothetical protein GMRT_12420 [Giardia muris]|uniref:Uncharacterized protein n=1 Tax=Giardia muris TaxID=5742 RepID=A0A4Z1SN89_GIAMU|nr:hypothetical protein GMRT_12420 [Giardia muris]|eukprot:TNJ27222.1 hypothetical protein GMRT_12420 [Giardia muris]